MKKLLLFLCLFSFGHIFSQATCIEYIATPDTSAMATDTFLNKGIYLYDRFGNKFSLGLLNFDYYYSNPNPSLGTELGSLAQPIATTCKEGMFTIHFVEEVTPGAGYGFENSDYRDVVCKVFHDINEMLVDPNPANDGRVHIFVASDSTFPIIKPGDTFAPGELGFGSSFRTLATPVDNVFTDNVAFQTIKLGKTAYSKLPNLLFPGVSDGYYHGYFAINFNGSFM